MTHTDVHKHAWSSTAETINLVARTTRNNCRHLSGQSRGYHQDQGRVNCHNDTAYTLGQDGGIPRSPPSSAPAPAPRMRFGATHNPDENTLARQPGTFRDDNRQLDGGTAPSATPSGGTSFIFRRCLCSAGSLSKNAAHMTFVKSPRRLRTILTS